MKPIAIMLFILALTVPNFAEVGTITLSNAVELALRNNLSLSQAEQDLGIAEAQQGQALADFAMPNITATAGLTFLDPDTVQNGIVNYSSLFGSLSIGGHAIAMPVMTNVYMDNYKTGISVTKPLFAGFRLWNSLKIRGALLELARARLEDKKKEVVSTVTTAFYNYFLLRENLRMNGELNKSLKDHMDYIANSYKAGNATEYDTIRASVQYKNNLPRLLQLSNSLISFKLSLCQQIGVEDPDGVEFVGSLYETTNLSLPVSGTKEILELALSNDISLKALDINLRVARLTKDVADGGKYPTLNAFFNFNYNYEKTNQMAALDRNWNPSWNTGLQLSIPLDGWVPVVSKSWNLSLEAEKNIKKLELQKRQIIDGIRLQVETLLLAAEQGRENMKSQEDSVSQSRLGYKMADERFKAGISTEMELIDAEVAVVQAEAGYLGALFDYFNSNLKLLRLIGQ